MPLYLCTTHNGGINIFKTEEWMRIWGFVFVVILIFNTFRGWFMDRFGWVWPMRWFGCAVLAAGSAAFYYIPQWFGANALMMIVASVIVGIGTCAFSSLPTIMTLYAGGKQGAALSAYNLAAGLTTFAGPGIATIPLPIVGYEGVCWTYAGLYVHPCSSGRSSLASTPKGAVSRVPRLRWKPCDYDSGVHQLLVIQPSHAKENHMAKPMTAFTTDFQHSGMPAKNLDETIKFYREVMGFEPAGLFMNGENRCAFLRYGHLTIETWEGDPAPMATGAISHWAFDTPGHRSRLRERQSARRGLQGRRDPIHPLVLEARHPILQHLWTQRRDHRILPDCGVIGVLMV